MDCWPLHQAVLDHSLETAVHIFQTHSPMDSQIMLRCTDEFGRMPLLSAIQHGQTSMVLLFLHVLEIQPGGIDVNYGPEVRNTDCRTGNTPLLETIGRGSSATERGCDTILRIVQRLLHLGSEVEHSNFLGQTPLLLAVCKGNLPVCKLLVERGVRFQRMPEPFLPRRLAHFFVQKDPKDLKDETEAALIPIPGEIPSTSPIFYAVTLGHFEIVKFLLDLGVDANEINPVHVSKLTARTPPDGWSLLHIAAKRNDPDLLTLLLDRGGRANWPSLGRGWTPMHVAAAYHCLDACRVLLEYGRCNVHLKTHRDQKTPLHLAIEYGMYGPESLPVVRYLVEQGGADVSMEKTAAGLNALDQAAKCNKHSVYLYLIGRLVVSEAKQTI